MKKFVCMMLSLLMLISVVSIAAADDVYEVVVEYPLFGPTPDDLYKIEAAINEYIEPLIGVNVKFYPVHAFELNSTSNLMVASGEKLDLMLSLFEGGVGGYVNKGILIELDDLVAEYGQDIVKAEGLAMAGGYFDGKLYAIPAEEKMGRTQAFLAREDLIDKYEIAYDPDHIYTMEELSDIFAVVKAGEGDRFYCVATNASQTVPFYSFYNLDFLGSNVGSGVLMNYGKDSTQIQNFYETPEFDNAATIMRSWFENGYFSPDVNTITDSAVALYQGGNYLGTFNNGEPDIINDWDGMSEDYFDCGIVPFFTAEPAAMTQFYQISVWGIPITCENPEKTMQFLNLLYKDEYLINLIQRGIEGEHYVFVEGSDKIIDLPEGMDPANRPYLSILNVWGDKSKDYVWAPLDETYYDNLAAFNASIDPEHTSVALGYCFNSEPVLTKMATVQDVITQYEASIGLGVVDPAEIIPDFLEALRVAGIDDIIAENQAQLDAWLATQE